MYELFFSHFSFGYGNAKIIVSGHELIVLQSSTHYDAFTDHNQSVVCAIFTQVVCAQI